MTRMTPPERGRNILSRDRFAWADFALGGESLCFYRARSVCKREREKIP